MFMISDSSIPAEHAEHQINVNSSCSLRTVDEQSINIDSFVAKAYIDEDQSSIANSVSRNTSVDSETSLSVNSGRTKKEANENIDTQKQNSNQRRIVKYSMKEMMVH